LDGANFAEYVPKLKDLLYYANLKEALTDLPARYQKVLPPWINREIPGSVYVVDGGCNIADGSFQPPKPTHKVMPDFPRNSVGGRSVGDVQADVRINEQGAVTQVWILRPAGEGRDEAVAEAMRQWKYTPAACTGSPRTVDATEIVHYTLR
jgi:TonB family protein